MIIRKPFAFIVQKFKLLHFITLIPMMYLIYKYYNLSQFFNRFVANGYVTNINNAVDIYYSFVMIIACVLILVFGVLLTALFKKKNKYYMPYLVFTIFYFVVLVYSLFSNGLLIDASNADLASSTSLIIKSLTSVLFYGQVIFVFAILLLAFGFDIRSGDFLDIKEEISLDEEDSEEVEISFVNEDYKYKRFINRYIREIKYYIIENKNVFKVFGGIIGIILAFFIGKYIISLTRVVKIDQSFNYSKMSLTFNNALLSKLDYTGNVIREGKIYLAVKLSAKNTSNDLLSISTSDFCLEISSGNCIYPILDKSGKFIDLALPYYGEKLGQGKAYEYVLVYELDEGQARGKYKIKILDSLTYKENEVLAKYREINITPSYSVNVIDVKNYNLGDEIDLSKSNLLNTKIKVNDFTISNTFRYNYDYCYKGECSKSMNNVSISSNSLFLVLDSEYKIDEKATYFKNNRPKTNFFSDFGILKYSIDGKDYYAALTDKTPSEVSDKVVLETTNSIKRADDIKLLLTIRDKRYTLNLGSKEVVD